MASGRRGWDCPACGAGGPERWARWCATCGATLQPAAPEPPATSLRLPAPALAGLVLVAGLAIAGLLARPAGVPLDPAHGSAQIDLPAPADLASPEPAPTSPPPAASGGGERWPSDHLAPPDIRCGHAAQDCVAWRHIYRSQDPHRYRPVLVLEERDLLVLLDGSRLEALDLDTGQVRWSSRVVSLGPQDAWRELFLVPRHDLIGVRDGASSLQVFDPASGATLWRRFDVRVEGQEVTFTNLWSVGGDLRMATLPVVELPDDEPPVPRTTRLLTIDPRTGEANDDDQVVTAAIGDDRAEVVLVDGRLTYRDAVDGRELWAAEVPIDLSGPVWLWLSEDVVEVSTHNDHYLLSRADGTPTSWPEPLDLLPTDLRPAELPDDVLMFSHHGERAVVLRRNRAERTSTLFFYDRGQLILERELPRGAGDCCVEMVGDVAVLWQESRGDAGRSGMLQAELIDLTTLESRQLHVAGEHLSLPWLPHGPNGGQPEYLLAQGRQGTTALRLPSGNVWWRTDHAAVWPLNEGGDLLGWPGGILRLDSRL